MAKTDSKLTELVKAVAKAEAAINKAFKKQEEADVRVEDARAEHKKAVAQLRNYLDTATEINVK